MIIQMLNQGQQPEQLIKYLLPQSLGSEHLNLTKDQYRAVKENQDLSKLLEKNALKIVQELMSTKNTFHGHTEDTVDAETRYKQI